MLREGVDDTGVFELFVEIDRHGKWLRMSKN